jgi:hypothetical protein
MDVQHGFFPGMGKMPDMVSAGTYGDVGAFNDNCGNSTGLFPKAPGRHEL